MSIETWGEQAEYPKIYRKLNSFPPKELLDRDIARTIESFSERDGLDVVLVAELGAGPAPISSLLTERDPEKYICSAFDKSPSMTQGVEYPFEYDCNFDLTDPNTPEEQLGRYDVVVLENALYATTMSSSGRKYTEKEAEIMRTTAFKKAASMLRPGGVLLISDPLKTTENFSVRRILEFLQYEQDALHQLRDERKSILEIFLNKLSDKDIQRILKINRGIMKRTVLLDEKDMKELINSSGLFFSEPLEYNAQSYLGSNITAVYRRNGKEIIREGGAELGGSVLLEGGIHDRVLHWIGEFRKERYEQTKATTNLPEVDAFDRKPEGTVVLWHSKNKLTPAATATFQERGKMGLDVEHLMLPLEGGFYEQLIKKISERSEKVRTKLAQGGTLKFGEIRRLATDSLGQTDFKELFRSMCDIFFKYAKKKDIDIVVFVSDKKRARAFNMANGIAQFEELDGFKLARENPSLQTMMIPAYNYFFSDWDEKLTSDEIELIKELSSMIKNGDLWTDVIKGHPKEQAFEEAVRSLFTKTADNVGIFFTDYAMHR